jgi:hypothetical protein
MAGVQRSVAQDRILRIAPPGVTLRHRVVGETGTVTPSLPADEAARGLQGEPVPVDAASSPSAGSPPAVTPPGVTPRHRVVGAESPLSSDVAWAKSDRLSVPNAVALPAALVLYYRV